MNYDIIGGLTSERIFLYALVSQEEPVVTDSLADSLINSTSSQAPSYASPKLSPTDSLTHSQEEGVELLA